MAHRPGPLFLPGAERRTSCIEWGVAEATGSAADAFLGGQGDPWDTQWDMFCCLIGAGGFPFTAQPGA